MGLIFDNYEKEDQYGDDFRRGIFRIASTAENGGYATRGELKQACDQFEQQTGHHVSLSRRRHFNKLRKKSLQQKQMEEQRRQAQKETRDREARLYEEAVTGLQTDPTPQYNIMDGTITRQSHTFTVTLTHADDIASAAIGGYRQKRPYGSARVLTAEETWMWEDEKSSWKTVLIDAGILLRVAVEYGIVKCEAWARDSAWLDTVDGMKADGRMTEAEYYQTIEERGRLKEAAMRNVSRTDRGWYDSMEGRYVVGTRRRQIEYSPVGKPMILGRVGDPNVIVKLTQILENGAPVSFEEQAAADFDRAVAEKAGQRRLED